MFVFQTGLRPRNPLLRLFGSLLGLLAVLGVLALGLFAFAAMLVVGAAWLLISLLRGKRQPARRPASAPADSGVIDGEFTVVRTNEQRPAIRHSTPATGHGRNG